MDAANAALHDAVKLGPAPEKQTKSAPFDSGRNAKNMGKQWHKLDEGSVVFFSNGGFPSIVPEFSAHVEGLYRVIITGRAYQSGDDVSFSLYAGTFGRNNDTHLLEVLQLPPKQTTRTLEVYLREREQLRVFPQLAQGIGKEEPALYTGAGLALMPFEIEGPIFEEWPGHGHELLFKDQEVRETEASKSKENLRNNKSITAAAR